MVSNTIPTAAVGGWYLGTWRLRVDLLCSSDAGHVEPQRVQVRPPVRNSIQGIIYRIPYDSRSVTNILWA